jgi:hypothetical protein
MRALCSLRRTMGRMLQLVSFAWFRLAQRKMLLFYSSNDISSKGGLCSQYCRRTIGFADCVSKKRPGQRIRVQKVPVDRVVGLQQLNRVNVLKVSGPGVLTLTTIHCCTTVPFAAAVAPSATPESPLSTFTNQALFHPSFHLRYSH